MFPKILVNIGIPSCFLKIQYLHLWKLPFYLSKPKLRYNYKLRIEPKVSFILGIGAHILHSMLVTVDTLHPLFLL